MSIRIDTDIVIGLLRGREREAGYFRSQHARRVAISIITYGEVYEGIYGDRNPRRHEEIFLFLLEFLLESLEVIALDEDIMKRFAMLRGHLRRRGQLIGDSDTLIAATALHHNLTLVTRNVRHFERVPALRLAAL